MIFVLYGFVFSLRFGRCSECHATSIHRGYFSNGQTFRMVSKCWWWIQSPHRNRFSGILLGSSSDSTMLISGCCWAVQSRSTLLRLPQKAMPLTVADISNGIIRAVFVLCRISPVTLHLIFQLCLLPKRLITFHDCVVWATSCCRITRQQRQWL